MDLGKLVFGDEAPIIRQRNFQLLLVAALPPVLGNTLISPILDSLIEPFGATPVSISLMISVFSAPAIVMISVAGGLADRFGRKQVLSTSLLLFGLCGTAIAFTADYEVVLVLRFVQGIGFSGVIPVIITSIGDLYTGEREATGQGIRFMASGLSGAVFPLAAGVLVLLAWQYPFLLYAMAIPTALALHRWFDEPERTSRDRSAGPAVEGSYLRELFDLGRRRRVLALVLARATMPMIWVGFLTYNSLIVVRLIGETPVEAGLLATVGFGTFALAASQAGRVASRVSSPFYPLVAANLGLAVGFGVVLFAPGIVEAALGMTVAGLGFGLVGALYRSLLTGLAPPRLRGGLVSLGEAGARVTITVTPLAMGGVIGLATPTHGFAGSLRLAGVGVAVLGAGCGIACLLVARSAPSSGGPERGHVRL